MKARTRTMILVDEFALRRSSFYALLLEWFQGEGDLILEMDMARATIHLEVEPDAQLILLNLGGGSLEDTQSRHSLRLLRGIAPKAPIAIIGERESIEEIQLAMRLGAQAFLPTSLDPDFVMTCLRFLKKGGSYFPTESLLAAVEDAAGDGSDDDGGRREISGGKGPALTHEGGGSGTPGEAEENHEDEASAAAVAPAEEIEAASLWRDKRTVAFAARDRGRIASIQSGVVPPPIRSVAFRPADPRGRDERAPDAHAPRCARDRDYPDVARKRDLEASERRPEGFPRSGRGAAETGSADPWGAAAGEGEAAQVGASGDRAEDQGVAPHLLLTPRQVEVLQLLKRGYSNKQIARKLNTTEPTVKVHVRQIIKKFGVENRTQVVWSLFQNGKAPI